MYAAGTQFSGECIGRSATYALDKPLRGFRGTWGESCSFRAPEPEHGHLFDASMNHCDLILVKIGIAHLEMEVRRNEGRVTEGDAEGVGGRVGNTRVFFIAVIIKKVRPWGPSCVGCWRPLFTTMFFRNNRTDANRFGADA